MRTRETIEAQASSANKPVATAEKYEHGKHPNSLKNLVAPWTSETRPESTGRPKKDMAQLIARQVFEQNPELIYKAFAKALGKGGAFAFQVLSDRAYGKLKETVEHLEGEVPDGSLEERVEQLERELYPAVFPTVTREADEAARVGSTQSGTQKANGAAKDPDLLPR